MMLKSSLSWPLVQLILSLTKCLNQARRHVATGSTRLPLSESCCLDCILFVVCVRNVGLYNVGVHFVVMVSYMAEQGVIS